MRIVSVGHELFPEIDKQMAEYLTSHILSVERSEMAQCLYFVADQMNTANNYNEVNKV